MVKLEEQKGKKKKNQTQHFPKKKKKKKTALNTFLQNEGIKIFCLCEIFLLSFLFHISYSISSTVFTGYSRDLLCVCVFVYMYNIMG